MEQEQEINLSKLNDWAKKNYFLIFASLVIISLIFVGYMIMNAEHFKKNACQLCEDSGRLCYEPNSTRFMPVGLKLVDNPFRNTTVS